MINHDRNLRLQYLAGTGSEPLSERSDLRRTCCSTRRYSGQHVHRVAGDARRRLREAIQRSTGR